MRRVNIKGVTEEEDNRREGKGESARQRYGEGEREWERGEMKQACELRGEEKERDRF